MKKLLIISLSIVCPCWVWGGSLSSTFSEVLVQNLQPGQRYSLTEIANFPYNVKNTGDESIQIKTEFVIPGKTSIRPGFEIIPDTGWVKLGDSQFILGSSATKTSDIVIEIPKNRRYLNKKYQVNIWSHTLNSNGGFAVTAGLESILLITTDKQLSDAASEKNQIEQSGANLNFDIQPRELIVKDIQIGKNNDISQLARIKLKITNLNKIDCKFGIRSLSKTEAMTSPKQGYRACPDPAFLSFSESEFKLGPKEEKEVSVYINFPDNNKFKDKKYMFVVCASAGELETSGGIYSRLYIETK